MSIELVGSHKGYSPQMNLTYDPIAKEASISLLKQLRCRELVPVKSQVQKYSILDMQVSNSSNQIISIECEARQDIDFITKRVRSKNTGEWGKRKMPDLHFPIRKVSSQADYFISYSIYNDMVVIVDRFDVFSSKFDLGVTTHQSDGTIQNEQAFFCVDWKKIAYFFRPKDSKKWRWDEDCGGIDCRGGMKLVPRYQHWNKSLSAVKFWNDYNALLREQEEQKHKTKLVRQKFRCIMEQEKNNAGKGK